MSTFLFEECNHQLVNEMRHYGDPVISKGCVSMLPSGLGLLMVMGKLTISMEDHSVFIDKTIRQYSLFLNISLQVRQ